MTETASAFPDLPDPKDDRVTASLRVFSNERDVVKIASLLRVNASILDPAKGVWVWRGSEGTGVDSLEAVISNLLASMPAEISVWDELQQYGTPEVFCGVFMKQMNRGVNLSSAIMEALAQRKLRLALDVYYSGEDWQRRRTVGTKEAVGRRKRNLRPGV
jgi:hypothetical protein